MSYTFEINKYYDLYQNALHWIKSMLLYDKIRLKEIPQEIRFSNNIIYITALRISNGISVNRLIEDLEVLCGDICSLNEKNRYSEKLLRIFSAYLNINNYKEEERFVSFQNNICKEILCALQRSNKSIQENIRQQLNNLPKKAELTGEAEEIHCDNCSEEYLFHLKDMVHEFSIGLVDILECLHFAEQQKAVPSLPPEWWISIEKRFPDFARRE
mgnify:CR=1 FL=1